MGRSAGVGVGFTFVEDCGRCNYWVLMLKHAVRLANKSRASCWWLVFTIPRLQPNYVLLVTSEEYHSFRIAGGSAQTAPGTRGIHLQAYRGQGFE